MTKLTLEIHDDVLKTLFKIQNINDTGIDLEIPEGSVLFDNIMNLKLIEKQAETGGKTVHFTTKDPLGNSLLAMIDESVDIQGTGMTEMTTSPDYPENTEEKFQFKMPTMPKIKVKTPKTAKPFIYGLILAVILFGIALYLTRTQTATATIKVASQPLARSVTVKVSASDGTDVSKSILKGTVVSTSLEGTKEIDTSGEKDVGEKAKGDVKIFNNTDSDKKFKKGTTLIYEDDDVDYKYVTLEDVEIPAKTTEMVYNKDLDLDQEVSTPGAKTVEVEAAVFGDKYNIKEDSEMEVSGQKSSNFYAKADEDIKGGKSEKVKVVSQEDLTKLKNDLLQELNNNIDAEMGKKIGKSQVLIKGSYKTAVTKEEYNHKVDDVSPKVSLTMVIQAEELTYLKSDLEQLMDSMVNNLIPEGFILSDEDTEIKSETLGNSTNSELSSQKADIQVTLKTYIVPNIVEDDLRKELKGKTVAQAEKILGGISNIKGYALDIKPGVPLFKKVPNNESQIEIIIERE